MIKIWYALLIYSVRAACPAHYLHLDMINQGVPVVIKSTHHTALSLLKFDTTPLNGYLHSPSPYIRERRLRSHWIGGSVRPSSFLGAEGKKRISASAGNPNLLHDPPARSVFSVY